MSILDNLKKFAQPYSDDEYDDYDDYDDDYEDEVEEEPVRRAPRKTASRPARAPRRAPVTQRDPEPVEDDYEEEDFASAFNSVPKATPAAAPAAAPTAPVAERSFPGKVVSMNRGGTQEFVRFHPASFQDSRKAASELVDSKPLIANLEGLDDKAALRMVDFLSGVVFAMSGDVQKIAKNIYVFCPPNVVITGGIEEVQSAEDDIL